MTSRDKLIDATLTLLRSQGFRGTGMNQIVEQSGAPKGSLYHHFPLGKEQLVIETLRTAGRNVEKRISDALRQHADTGKALRAYLEAYAREIRESDFQRGCPVGNVAMDVAATEPNLRTVCNEIFKTWASLIARRLQEDGAPKAEAESLAEFVISSLEGALILCRAQRSTQPLQHAAKRIELLVKNPSAKGGARKGAR
jgi:TetR/AcrR family transcriptional repressor of lmrAB and yxaGH operons